MIWARNLDGSKDPLQAKWNQVKEALVKINNPIIQDEEVLNLSTVNIWKFRKKGWGKGMWAEIESTFIYDNEIDKIIQEVVNAESGCKITNTGVKARN